MNTFIRSIGSNTGIYFVAAGSLLYGLAFGVWRLAMGRGPCSSRVSQEGSRLQAGFCSVGFRVEAAATVRFRKTRLTRKYCSSSGAHARAELPLNVTRLGGVESLEWSWRQWALHYY